MAYNNCLLIQLAPAVLGNIGPQSNRHDLGPNTSLAPGWQEFSIFCKKIHCLFEAFHWFLCKLIYTSSTPYSRPRKRRGWRPTLPPNELVGLDLAVHFYFRLVFGLSKARANQHKFCSPLMFTSESLSP